MCGYSFEEFATGTHTYKYVTVLSEILAFAILIRCIDSMNHLEALFHLVQNPCLMWFVQHGPKTLDEFVCGQTKQVSILIFAVANHEQESSNMC